MDWIDDTVAVGNLIDGVSEHRHRQEGVDIIIDARVLFTQSTLPFRRTPIMESLLMARNRLVDISPLKPKVLIFCNRGRDRSSFVAMLYVSKRYGMSYQEAYKMVRSKRKQTAFHWDWVEVMERAKPP
jgi:hypothetical protein